jgi:hypothetical protein
MIRLNNLDMIFCLLCIAGCSLSLVYVYLRVQGIHSVYVESGLICLGVLGLFAILGSVLISVYKYMNEVEELADIFKSQKITKRRK